MNIAFSRLEEGYENALKDYNKKQIQQLNQLITMLIDKLSKGDRQKIMTICTIDVHARDVVAKMISHKVLPTFYYNFLLVPLVNSHNDSHVVNNLGFYYFKSVQKKIM